MRCGWSCAGPGLCARALPSWWYWRLHASVIACGPFPAISVGSHGSAQAILLAAVIAVTTSKRTRASVTALHCCSTHHSSALQQQQHMRARLLAYMGAHSCQPQCAHIQQCKHERQQGSCLTTHATTTASPPQEMGQRWCWLNAPRLLWRHVTCKLRLGAVTKPTGKNLALSGRNAFPFKATHMATS